MSELSFQHTGRRDAASADRRFHLDTANRKFIGVCSGIADSFGWGLTLVRTGFVAGTLMGFGSLIIIYLAMHS